MPVTGSSFALSAEIVHDGVMRLSDEEAAETMSSGTSRAVAMGGGIDNMGRFYQSIQYEYLP